MGRPRSKDFDLPPGVHRRGERYYFGRNNAPLGGPSEWFARYAELRSGEAPAGTFADGAALYARQELRTKAPKTQAEYSRQLVTLVKTFGAMRWDEIAPGDVADFLQRRPPIAGTREKALLSAVFNFARARHLTTAPNPCAGIRGKKSERSRYVADAELAEAIRRARAAGDQVLADFLRLLYRSGQRPSDALRIPAAAPGGELIVRQTKRGALVRVRLKGDLQVLHRRLAHGAGELEPLIRSRHGESVRLQALRRRLRALGITWWFADVRAKAATDLPDVGRARDLLGHAHESTTDAYRRSRIGRAADPVTRRIMQKRRK